MRSAGGARARSRSDPRRSSGARPRPRRSPTTARSGRAARSQGALYLGDRTRVRGRPRRGRALVAVEQNRVTSEATADPDGHAVRLAWDRRFDQVLPTTEPADEPSDELPDEPDDPHRTTAPRSGGCSDHTPDGPSAARGGLRDARLVGRSAAAARQQHQCGGSARARRRRRWQRADVGRARARASSTSSPGPATPRTGRTTPRSTGSTPFEQQTGCKVNVKIGNTSDEMVQLMRTGQYDGVSASGDADAAADLRRRRRTGQHRAGAQLRRPSRRSSRTSRGTR